MASDRKNTIAFCTEYPPIAPKTYYTLAFKKTALEKEEVKQIKLQHKREIAEEFKEYSAKQRQKIMNPTSYKLAS